MESVISKPWSPIRHDMASSESGITRRARRDELDRAVSEAAVPAMTTTAPAPSAKSELATTLFGIPAILVVKAAHLDRAQQHAGRRIGGDKRLRHPQAVECSVAAHEAHVGARDAGGKSQLLDQRDIEARRIEPGA